MKNYPKAFAPADIFRYTIGMMKRPPSFFRWLYRAEFLRLFLALILLGWWGYILYDHYHVLAILESRGALSDLDPIHLSPIMIWGESLVFFSLLLASSVFLFLLYRREVKQQKNLHAFYASMAHELRTPLSSIQLQAEAIVEKMKKRGQEPRLLARLLEDVGKLNNKMERALELARITGGGSLNLAPHSWRTQCEAMLQNWQESCSDFSYDCEGEDCPLIFDPHALTIILNNIFENTCRHSGAAAIHLSVQGQKTPQGFVLRFADNGQGCPDIKMLGDLFAKGQNSSGTGVGLFMIKKLMEQMHGAVDWKNENGFVTLLTFPHAQNQEG